MPKKHAVKMPAFAAGFLWALAALFPAAWAADEKDAVAASLERRQRVELLSFFLKDPGEATLPTTPDSIIFFNEAVAHFQKHEYDLARTALSESIKYDDQNALAYELLGDVDNLEQKLKDAKANYEIAYNLQPTAGLLAKIQKINLEVKVDKKLDTYEEEHFLIKYYNDELRPVEGWELRELLRKTYLKLSKEFAYYFRHKVVVLLYDNEDFVNTVQSAHWAAGVYDGKVRMPINRKGFTDKDLEAIVTHEVTHAFVAAMSQLRAPLWINEGLATYQEYQIRPGGASTFESAVKAGQMIPLGQFIEMQDLMKVQDVVFISLFYQQAHALVKYLVARYGMFRVKQILIEFGGGKSSGEAIENILKISPAWLEREWKDSL